MAEAAARVAHDPSSMEKGSAASSDTAAADLSAALSGEVPEEEPQFHHRHGTWKTCVMHIMTAVIGAGVLALPSAIAWLGWVGGMAALLAFAAITLYTSNLLAACYFVRGKRNRTYMEVVQAVMGRRSSVLLGILQYVNLFLAAITFNIAGGLTMQEIACLAQNKEAGCSVLTLWQSILIFAAGQLLLSQTPSLDESWVGSALGAAMSFGYSTIALSLSIDQVADGNHHGTVGGRDASDKVFGVFSALGTVVFAFGFSLILIEIQDTLAGPPPDYYHQPASRTALASLSQFLSAAHSGAAAAADSDASDTASPKAGEVAHNGSDEGKAGSERGPQGALDAPGPDDRQRWQVVQMQKAVCLAITIITAYFTSVGVFGYLAFGDQPCGTGGNILTCFDSPKWLLITANSMVLVHIFPAYQVFTQPVFGFLEGFVRRSPRFPPAASSRPAVVAGRCIYVILVAVISMCLPFFSDMVGLVGAMAFWPATVYFPITMYIRVYRPGPRAVWWMQALSMLCLCITLCAIVGSVQQIVDNASSYEFFAD